MTFGEKIRARRIELNMTMEDLGREVGIQRSAINKYEKGTIDDPKASIIQAFAKALDVSIFYLLDDEPSVRMDLSETEREIIISYRKAEKGVQSSIRKLLDVEEKKPAITAG